MNLEIEAFEGELRELRIVRRNYLELSDANAQIEKYNKEVDQHNARNEEFHSLGQACSGQQEKIHQMALTIARLQARLDAINGIASRAKPR